MTAAAEREAMLADAQEALASAQALLAQAADKARLAESLAAAGDPLRALALADLVVWMGGTQQSLQRAAKAVATAHKIAEYQADALESWKRGHLAGAILPA